ncbi:glycoside hydrolase family 17 [Lecanosticta acicola]|uniref:glucan endo-1,3-beta-D-glucosidase n=1 Tax=Lecanosticta acicola TaxID=111012 RepID=A0AAI8Z5T6_9PEZI|nr:glycoside hydrolase family 17 [Lecanosticta acicola]
MSERQYGIPNGFSSASGSASPPQPPPHAPRIAYPQAPGRQIAPDRNPMAALPPDNTLRDIDNLYTSRNMPPPPINEGPYGAPGSAAGLNNPRQNFSQADSQSSLAPLTNAYPMANSTPPRSPERTAQRGVAPAAGLAAADFDGHMPRASYYHGDGYDNFDLDNIADDGDDGFEEQPRSRSGQLAPAAGAAAGAGAGAGMLSALGSRGPSGGNYGPVGGDPEKSEWLAKQSSGNKRLKWIIGITVVLLILGGIAGGVAGGLLAKKNSGDGGSSGGSSGSHSGGLYDLNSKEVKAVMNNKKLHKVFPAMDYTPHYAQYPQCLSKGGGPSQNNVTIDLAIMSQLTPAVRLYGTDCNQTELVMESLDRLELNDMKVWLGVYLNGNQTTNDRQIKQLYDILDKYDHSRFVGVIIGNEVLFSKYMTATQLQSTLTDVRNNFTQKNIQLPVATADLGDNWTDQLAQASDIVMANIHPFFAGTAVKEAAGWAYSFWQNKNIPLTTAKTGTAGSLTYPKQVISEIGWPSQGGNDCGDATSSTYGCTGDTDGAVASTDNVNTFMDTWVCGALNNGTTFFWFEAFDEDWKHQFDTAHNHWEPYWGLFDVNRNLKDGLNIPDCGGKTVDKPY